MTSSNKYQLFISNHCSSCAKILTKLEEENINVAIINIEKDQYDLPFKLMIIPALVKERKLISYGVTDIINQLNQI
jgi:arsenate reductase-like glutaredoxin family protein